MSPRRPRLALLTDSLSSEYSAQLRRSIERAATSKHLDVMVFTGMRLGSPDLIESTQNRIYDLATKERVDAVIVIGATLSHYGGKAGMLAFCRKYAALPLCIVGVALDGIPSLVVDNHQGMELGVSHLIDFHQARRIAFIAGPAAGPESNERLQGYRQALRARGIEPEEELLAYGDFTFASGKAGMLAILQRGVTFDAVAAANDYMALGALDVLSERGIRVPGDVIVCGFDDIYTAACARPSLSTLRQPLWWLGAEAVGIVLRQMQGEAVPPLTVGTTEFVRRESCGCGYQLALTMRPSGPTLSSLRDVLRDHREAIAQRLREAVSIPNDALGDWPQTLVNALDAELSGNEGHFNQIFEQVLEAAQVEGASLDEFQRVVSTLRAELRRSPIADPDEGRRVERLWHASRVLVGTASIRSIGRQRIDTQHATSLLGRTAERFATTLSLPLLKAALVEELPVLHLEQAAISLYDARSSTSLRPFLVMREGREQVVSDEPFPDTRLSPDAALESAECYHSVVVPLTFEAESLGVAVFSSKAVASVYEALRQQIGSAIKGALLHRQVVAQVALRERLEQTRLTDEAQLAVKIQTRMNPTVLDVPGLELVARMIPAAEAGGDYYDVLPDESGAWLAIGDVAGHGLGAGLVTLMIQSMVSSLARSAKIEHPSEIVAVVNDALYDNVRHRLKRDDHATLTVFRYERDGRLTFSGAHEPVIVYRARTGRCELFSPPGFWVGAVPDIRRLSSDVMLQLEPADLLILHTDGMTEARNAQREQFGLERLTEMVESVAGRPLAWILESLFEGVKSWSSSLDDDVTLVVARYQPESPD